MRRRPEDYKWNMKALVYDPVSNTWAEFGDNPYLPNTGAAFVVAGGAYFIGSELRADAGHLFAHEGLTKHWATPVFFLREGIGNMCGALPCGRAYGASFTIDEGLLIVGGEDNTAGCLSAVVGWEAALHNRLGRACLIAPCLNVQADLPF